MLQYSSKPRRNNDDTFFGCGLTYTICLYGSTYTMCSLFSPLSVLYCSLYAFCIFCSLFLVSISSYIVTMHLNQVKIHGDKQSLLTIDTCMAKNCSIFVFDCLKVVLSCKIQVLVNCYILFRAVCLGILFCLVCRESYKYSSESLP